jgi:hypothetical protein
VSAAPQDGDRVRTAELAAALCLATDLGMAFPFEHGLHTTLIAMRLADRLGVDRQTLRETYYASLLAHAGCTADAHVTPLVFGDSLTTKFHPGAFGSGREVLGGLPRALPEDGAGDASAPHRLVRGGGDARRRTGRRPVGAAPSGLPA